MRRFVKLMIAVIASTASLACTGVFAAAPNAASADSIAEIGTLQRASYRIDIPSDWNHSLIVFYHGTSTTPVTFAAADSLSPMFAPMLKQGYALIQSGYSVGGWAVEQADADTERLRARFIDQHGQPKHTFVLGMSMGGTLAVMTVETRPDVYAGALSLCGAIEPSNRLMQRDFALAAAFEYYFPGVLAPLLSLPVADIPEQARARKIRTALASKPAATQSLLRWYGTGNAESLAAVLAGESYEVRELQQRTGGNPFGNADLIYINSGDDFALNDGVHRYRAEAAAATYLARWYTPTGKLTRPLLDLHDTGDPLVPASSAFEYALTVQRAGHGDNFVQQYVNREGHCVFTPAEIGHAFDELVAWANAGTRPSSGKLN
jgi:pimeloyl-ACP methyl ester carboxylesterase